MLVVVRALVPGSSTMHPQSPSATIGETVQIVSDGLDILEVTFGTKMIFEKHLCSVSRVGS